MSHGENMSDEKGGIYIHVPFCVRKCDYCDFYSLTDLSLRTGFVNALIREMELMSPQVNFPCDSLYFGGGTPSLLTCGEVRRIMENIYRCFDLHENSEITLEANPGTITERKLAKLRECGINRINIGVQSFRDDNLSFLGRIHTSQEAVSALNAAGKIFDNIGLDLMYGLPELSSPNPAEKQWEKDLEKALSFAPAHLSCYLLTYEKGTPLTENLEKGKFRPQDEEQAARLLEFTAEFLESRGYMAYEISNYARSPALQSRHNRKYWSFAPYAGLGPAAHSLFPPERRWNVPSVADYIRRLRQGILPIAEKEIRSREQQMMETVYLGLRKREGIRIADFEKRFACLFDELFGKTVAYLQKEGLLEKDAARCALSRKGLRYLDSITSLFADGCPESDQEI